MTEFYLKPEIVSLLRKSPFRSAMTMSSWSTWVEQEKAIPEETTRLFVGAVEAERPHGSTE